MIDLRRADGLLTEALAEHADGRTDAPGCYALDIATPEGGHETHARAWLDAGYETPPPYLDAIVDADRVLYVGRSANVRDRIADHLSGEVRKATLPSVYDVRGIYDVRWGENSDTAERQFADDLRHETGADTFVHTR